MESAKTVETKITMIVEKVIGAEKQLSEAKIWAFEVGELQEQKEYVDV